MLDRKFIIENVELIQQNCRNRGVRADVEQLVQKETERREKLQLVQELNRQANEVSGKIGKA